MKDILKINSLINLKRSLDRKVFYKDPAKSTKFWFFSFPLYFYYIIHLTFFMQLVDTYANVATACATMHASFVLCHSAVKVAESAKQPFHIRTKYDRWLDILISVPMFDTRFDVVSYFESICVCVELSA